MSQQRNRTTSNARRQAPFSPPRSGGYTPPPLRPGEAKPSMPLGPGSASPSGEASFEASLLLAADHAVHSGDRPSLIWTEDETRLQQIHRAAWYIAGVIFVGLLISLGVIGFAFVAWGAAGAFAR